MIEFALIYPYNDEQWEKVNEAFNETSLLGSHSKKLQSLNILSGAGLLVWRQLHFHQGNAVYVDEQTGNFTLLYGYLISDKLDASYTNLVEVIHKKMETNSYNKNVNFIDNFLGEFTIIKGDRDNIEIYQSLSETFPVYNSKIALGTILISSRSTFCSYYRELETEIPVVNLGAQIDVCAFDSINGNDSFDVAVNTLPAYSKIVLNKTGLNFQELISRWTFNQDISPANNIDEAYKTIVSLVDWLVNNLKVLPRQFQLDRNLVFNLSGGKDSRILLALFLKSGLMDYHKEILTLGDKEDPEVLAAMQISKTLTIPHSIKPRVVGKNRFFELLGKHIFQMEGEINPRVLHGNYEGVRPPIFTGHEVGLRDAFVSQAECKTWKDVISYIDNKLPWDPIGILRNDVSDNRKKNLYNIIDLAQRFNIKPENFFNFFQAYGRGRRWVGKLTSSSSAAGPYMNILCSTQVIKILHHIGPAFRRYELFHFGLIKHLYPEWINLPFAGQSWNQQLVDNKLCDLVTAPVWGQKKEILSPWWIEMYRNKEDFIRSINLVYDNRLDKIVVKERLFDYIKKTDNPSERAMLSIFSVFSMSLVLKMKLPCYKNLSILKKLIEDEGSKYISVKETKTIHIKGIQEAKFFLTSHNTKYEVNIEATKVIIDDVVHKINSVELIELLCLLGNKLDNKTMIVINFPNILNILQNHSQRMSNYTLKDLLSLNRTLYGWGHKLALDKSFFEHFLPIFGFANINESKIIQKENYVEISAIKLYRINEKEYQKGLNLLREELEVFR